MCGLHYIILLQSLIGEGAQGKRDIIDINSHHISLRKFKK